MDTRKSCPSCGSDYDSEKAFGGQCPRCLLEAGVDTLSVPGQVGQAIGPYSILDTLGEGGMGIVYLAEQKEPIRRRVALKIIKPGMDTEQVIARFESERQALALMNHPNVAKVFDAGVTERGGSYFVMEYVAGVPITDYCDRLRLDLRARLDLFTQACQAIQHAHQKGIIHRDVKPSNALVCEVDGNPQVKIIDFGVAKATAQKLTERTLFTQKGVLIGTPEYMSPEQADPGGPDVDTRSDVYSLGVLLYELCVGALPFDPTELRHAGFEEILRRIREDEPPRPSRRVSSSGDATRDTARNRGTDPGTLERRLRGDLDWVVMKALEKLPARRYASPSELAADVGRFLHDEPVAARPPSVSYRVGKFVRRYRVGVVASLVVLIGLVAGGTIATWQAVRATRAEAQAGRDARAAERVADFMVGLFEAPTPGQARGDEVTAREILERGVDQISEGLEDEPLIQARLLRTMSLAHRSLGLFGPSLDLGLRAAEIEQEQLGRLAPSTLVNLGTAYARAGRFDDAHDSFERARTMYEQQVGPNDPLVADVLHRLGTLHAQMADFGKAREFHRRALALREQALGPDHPDVGFSLRGLGDAYGWGEDGDPAAALPLLQRAQAIFEASLGDDHPVIADNLDSMGLMHQQQNETNQARELFEAALEIRRRVLGPDHPVIAYSLYNVAGLLVRTGELDQARPLYEEAIRIRETALGPGHPDTAAVIERLGILWAYKGDPQRARALLEQSLSINERALGRLNAKTSESAYNLAMLLSINGRKDDAFRYLFQAAEGRFVRPANLEQEAWNTIRDDPRFAELEESVRSYSGQQSVD